MRLQVIADRSVYEEVHRDVATVRRGLELLTKRLGEAKSEARSRFVVELGSSHALTVPTGCIKVPDGARENWLYATNWGERARIVVAG